MKQHKSLLSIKKVPSEHILTLTFCHKFKSEPFFGKKAKIKHVFGLILTSLYIIYVGVCVSNRVISFGKARF